MDVQMISVEAIKPSSPTPFHLKNFNLSLLDQFIPAPYAPIIFFYPNPRPNSTTHLHDFLENLKKSLSETLTLFYPLAGELKDNLSIDCTDQGAHFATANVKNINLSQFLTKVDIQLLDQLIPCGTGFESESLTSKTITNIQVNVFECGGLAMGICIAHKILDGTSLSTFLKSWTNAAHNHFSASSKEKMIISPDFIANSLFPTNNSTWFQDSASKMFFSFLRKGNPRTKRFVFPPSSIEDFRARSTRSGSRSPSRVVTVSAFLWKCFIDNSTKLSNEKCYVPKKPSLLTHLVNLRRKAQPNLSDNSIGNLLWITGAKLLRENDLTQEELPSLAWNIEESLSKIDGEFVKKLGNGDEGHVLMRESMNQIKEFASIEGGVDQYGFTSRCKVGFYEVEFGWGKPIWVSNVGVRDNDCLYMNFIALMDTRCGEGVEAWVTLDERDMELFEQNVELQDFVHIDPSPLDINGIHCVERF